MVTTPSSLTEALETYNKVQAYKKFILDRFKVYAMAHLNLDVDKEIKASGNWLSFEVNDHPLFDERVDHVSITSILADERSAGMRKTYRMPKSAIYQLTDKEEAYRDLQEAQKRFEAAS